MVKATRKNGDCGKNLQHNASECVSPGKEYVVDIKTAMFLERHKNIPRVWWGYRKPQSKADHIVNAVDCGENLHNASECVNLAQTNSINCGSKERSHALGRPERLWLAAGYPQRARALTSGRVRRVKSTTRARHGCSQTETCDVQRTFNLWLWKRKNLPRNLHFRVLGERLGKGERTERKEPLAESVLAT
jgi:hypothetical protein